MSGTDQPMRMTWPMWCAVLIVAMVGAASAEDAAQVKPEARQGGDMSTVSPTPRQLIDALIAERQPPPTLEPATAPPVRGVPERVGVPAPRVDPAPAILGVLPGRPLPRLRREGAFVVARPGRLISRADGTHWVFDFEPVAGEPALRPMIVQKCRHLASMQAALKQADEDLLFTVTGQVHTYRGANFLLPTAIVASQKLPDPAASQPDAPPTSAAPEPEPFQPFIPSPDADARDVMERLLEERGPPVERLRPARVDHRGQRRLAGALRGPHADSKRSPELRREGDYVVNRAGRLIRGGPAGDVLFAFEADGSSDANAEAPMVLMPCKLLALMEDSVAERGDQITFVVSGRVYTYGGANHLLPTTVRQEYDLGNLAR